MKDTKKKDNFKTIVISSITLFAIIVFVLVVCVMCSKNGNNVNNKQTTGIINVNDYIKEDEHLTINAKDCTLYIDDIIKLQCYSNPPDYAKGASWSSSDNTVLTVAFDGTVTAISEGIAAVTVTHGVLTDSIIIKVIDRETPVDEEFPVFDPAQTEPIPTIPSTVTPTVVPNTSSEVQVIDPTTQDNPTTKAPENETTTEEVEQSQPSSEDNTTESSADMPSETEKETVSEAVKDTILNNLPGNGFSVYLTDTYVFEEDGNYLGQVIVTENFTQIYVMTRTTNFDGKLKSFLSTVLPTGYMRAFDNLATAKKDMTFYVDGYKVRVVASPNGGHSQLIIYYN